MADSDLDVEFYVYETTSAAWAGGEARAQMLAYFTDLDTLVYRTVGVVDKYVPLLDTNYDTKTAIRHIALNSAGSVGLGSEAGRIVFTDDNPDTANFTELDVRFSGSTVAHGMTSIVPTDVYGRIKYYSSATGGVLFDAYSDTDERALSLLGVIGTASPTATTPVIEIVAAKKNGTTSQALGNDETALQVLNSTTKLATVMGDGHTGFGTVAPQCRLHVVESDVVQTVDTDAVLCVERSNDAIIHILTSGENVAGIIMGTDGTANQASLIWEDAGLNLELRIAGTAKLSVDSATDDVIMAGSNFIQETQRTPATAGAAGTKGTICHDTGYIYVCTATNTWERVAIATW